MDRMNSTDSSLSKPSTADCDTISESPFSNSIGDNTTNSAAAEDDSQISLLVDDNFVLKNTTNDNTINETPGFSEGLLPANNSREQLTTNVDQDRVRQETVTNIDISIDTESQTTDESKISTNKTKTGKRVKGRLTAVKFDFPVRKEPQIIQNLNLSDVL